MEKPFEGEKALAPGSNPHKHKLILVDRLASSIHASVDLEKDRCDRRDFEDSSVPSIDPDGFLAMHQRKEAE